MRQSTIGAAYRIHHKKARIWNSLGTPPIISPLCLVWVRAPLWPHVRQAKFCLRCDTYLYSHRRRLEAWNFRFEKNRDCTCTICVAKIKVRIGCAVTAVYSGIAIFRIFNPKHRLCILKQTNKQIQNAVIKPITFEKA